MEDTYTCVMSMKNVHGRLSMVPGVRGCEKTLDSSECAPEGKRVLGVVNMKLSWKRAGLRLLSKECLCKRDI